MKVALKLRPYFFLGFVMFSPLYRDETMNRGEKKIIPTVESVAFPLCHGRRFQIIYSFASIVSFIRFDVRNRFRWNLVRLQRSFSAGNGIVAVLYSQIDDGLEVLGSGQTAEKFFISLHISG